MCACVFTEGEVKAMYGRGGWRTAVDCAVSPNHLDVRDTVSAEWLHYQTNTHAYTHICVCPPGPRSEVECISLLCPGRRGCWEGGGGWWCGWGGRRGGSREAAAVRKYAHCSTRDLSGAAGMTGGGTNVINLRGLLASQTRINTRTHTHTNTQNTRPVETSLAHMLETCICLQGILTHTQMLV